MAYITSDITCYVIAMHFFLKIHKLDRKPVGAYLSTHKNKEWEKEREWYVREMGFLFNTPLCLSLHWLLGIPGILENPKEEKREREINSQVHQSEEGEKDKKEEKRRKVLLQQCMLGHGQTESWHQMALWVNPLSFDQEVQTCLPSKPTLMHAHTHNLVLISIHAHNWTRTLWMLGNHRQIGYIYLGALSSWIAWQTGYTKLTLKPTYTVET